LSQDSKVPYVQSEGAEVAPGFPAALCSARI
jgi:hypothetical protein